MTNSNTTRKEKVLTEIFNSDYQGILGEPKMTTSERSDAIRQAIDLIMEAQDLVKEAVNGTSQEAHFNAYGQYGITQLLGNGNRYDSSLYSLIEEMEEQEITFKEAGESSGFDMRGI